MAKFETIPRKFKLKSTTIPDPNPLLSPEEVRKHLMAQFPELLNCIIVGPKMELNSMVYEFSTQTGTLG